MTNLSPAGQKLVEEYLARLRQSLSGCSESERNDTVAEVRSHIEEAVNRMRQDDGEMVSALLRSLGEPEQYAASLRAEPAPKACPPEKRKSSWTPVLIGCAVALGVGLLVAGLLVILLSGLFMVRKTAATGRMAAPPVVTTKRIPATPPAQVEATRTPETAALAREAALVVRAVKGELTDDERAKLPGDHAALAMQLADPNTKPLLEFFAEIPENFRRELLEKGYVKWKYTSLDAARQEVCRKVVQLNIDLIESQRPRPATTMSLSALERSDVGFAVVDIPETKQTVISWFILFPERSAPLWVTVVGAQAAGTGPYFQAHLRELPKLRQKPESPLPQQGAGPD